MANTASKRQAKHSPAQGVGDSSGLVAILIVGLVVAVTVAYANSFNGVFVFDDEGHIVNDASIRSLSPIWKLIGVNNPRPVVTLSLALNYAMTGLNPSSYHAFNFIVHLLAACVLFDILRRTLLLVPNAPDIHRAAPLLAFSITVLWAVHPLQTQSVTYIIQRSESMMGLGFLVTIYGLILGARSSRPWAWYCISLAACGIGMATKVVLVAAPIVAFCYDILFLETSIGSVFRKRGLYYALMIVVIVFVLFWTGLFNSILNPSPGYEVTVGFGIKGLTPWGYLTTQAGVIIHYLRLSFWPDELCIDYDWHRPASLAETILPGLPLLIALAVTVWGLIRRRPWSMIGVWFFGVLAPTSSFIPVKDYIMEHRMYLPLAAIPAALVFGVRRLIRFPALRASQRAMIGGGAVCLAAIALTARTIDRNRVYYSVQALWTDVVRKQPGSPRAWVNYGESMTRVKNMTEAINAYRKAGQLSPESSDAFYNLGNAFQAIGAMDDAEQAYIIAKRLNPKDLMPKIMLGNVYVAQELPKKAEVEFREAVAAADRTTDPMNLAKAHFNLGNSLARQARLSEALTSYQLATTIAPNYDKAHHGLGWCYEQLGRRKEAFLEYQRSLELNPQNMEARRAMDSLSRTLSTEEQIQKAGPMAPAATRPNSPGTP